ncbi:TPA: helix-turn-helix transcriptional regulator [Enterobacter kobei]|nr:helix-turn-helix transcriptional regulator [Enterobacter kobei]HDT5467150.1 helix-turn-helix transcriptional regulator [Enterobacter kobei]HEP0394281.1 helix-turn-helix transcriptional regulator [Enterobacter kobei]
MNNIAKQRKEIGVSQAALASAIGWGQSRIANYELNIRTPSLSDCRSIVSADPRLWIVGALLPEYASEPKGRSQYQQRIWSWL